MSPPAEHLPHINNPTWEWWNEAPPPVLPTKRWPDAGDQKESPSKKAKTGSTMHIASQRAHSASQEHGAHMSSKPPAEHLLGLNDPQWNGVMRHYPLCHPHLALPSTGPMLQLRGL